VNRQVVEKRTSCAFFNSRVRRSPDSFPPNQSPALLIRGAAIPGRGQQAVYRDQSMQAAHRQQSSAAECSGAIGYPRRTQFGMGGAADTGSNPAGIPHLDHLSG
jgi:hypothetical protein